MATLQFSPILLLNYIFISFGYQIFFFLSRSNVFEALFAPVIRWATEKRRALIGEFGSRNIYLPTLARHFSEDATCNVDEAFDFEVIDLCYNKEEMDLKETFYMDFYDSNNLYYGGLNYYRGPTTWGVVGKQIPREELFGLLLEGHDFNYLQNHFGVSETTLRKKFGKYIIPMLEHIPVEIQLPASTINQLNQFKVKFTQSSESSLGIRDAKFVILVLYVAPKLYNLIRSGLTLYESLKWLSDNSIKFVEGLQQSRNAMNERVCKRIWGKNYAECREDFFINPLIEDLRNQGIDFIIGESTEKIDPQEIKSLLDQRSAERFVIGEGTQELGLIEWLALSGLKGWTEVAQALDVIGVFERDSKRTPAQKASDAIRRYVMYRWGEQYGRFDVFVQFLRTHYIGRNDH